MILFFYIPVFGNVVAFKDYHMTSNGFIDSIMNNKWVLLAEKQGADYLGVGAVFPTDSKEDAETIDLKVFEEICKVVKIPVVAIGGITKENIDKLKGMSAKGVALISAAVDGRASCRERV